MAFLRKEFEVLLPIIVEFKPRAGNITNNRTDHIKIPPLVSVS